MKQKFNLNKIMISSCALLSFFVIKSAFGACQINERFVTACINSPEKAIERGGHRIDLEDSIESASVSTDARAYLCVKKSESDHKLFNVIRSGDFFSVLESKNIGITCKNKPQAACGRAGGSFTFCEWL